MPWGLSPLKCFVGAWSILNATLTNTETGDPVQAWHSVYPCGASVYSESGYYSTIMTANDTTHRQFRPTDLELPARPTDDIPRWALVSQYSLATGGRFELVYDKDKHWGQPHFTGNVIHEITTATLPSMVGRVEKMEFEFYGDLCSGHVLRYTSNGVLQTVYYQREPDHLRKE